MESVSLNYDVMQDIVKTLQNEEAELRQLLGQTKSKVEALHGNQWVGKGADQFFSEMEGEVLPAMGKMVYALDVAGNVAKQIMSIIHAADEETKNYFNNIGA